MLLEWRLSPHGDWWVYVYWTADIPGYQGGLEPRQTWFHEGHVEKIRDVNYTGVPTTQAGPARPPPPVYCHSRYNSSPTEDR